LEKTEKFILILMYCRLFENTLVSFFCSQPAKDLESNGLLTGKFEASHPGVLVHLYISRKLSLKRGNNVTGIWLKSEHLSVAIKFYITQHILNVEIECYLYRYVVLPDK
jgi:uncharacterized membrane protein